VENARRLAKESRPWLEPAYRARGVPAYSSTDVILPLENGEDLRLRCVVQPDDAQKILLDHLGLTLPQRLLSSDANGKM